MLWTGLCVRGTNILQADLGLVEILAAKEVTLIIEGTWSHTSATHNF